MNKIILPFFFTVSIAFLSLSSKSPLYFAPATIPAISKENTILSAKSSGTLPFTIAWARPSTTALLPTPGSPIKTGLFFVLLDKIWITRSISLLLPITGSNLPSIALRFRFTPNLPSSPSSSSSTVFSSLLACSLVLSPPEKAFEKTPLASSSSDSAYCSFEVSIPIIASLSSSFKMVTLTPICFKMRTPAQSSLIKSPNNTCSVPT